MNHMKIALILWLGAAAACGSSNVFESQEKVDVAQEAAIEMEKGRPERAVEMLLNALESDPENYKLHSLVSAAIAQYFSVDPVGLALKMAKNQTSTTADGESGSASSASGGDNGIEAMFAVLPEATDEIYEGVEEAILHLEIIPEAYRTKSDSFKLSMLHTALLALRTKKLDRDGDGQVSPVELLSMSDADAISIISSLLASQTAFSGSASGDGSQAAGEQIATIKAAIDAQEGATDADKLKNYLNKGTSTVTASPTPTPSLTSSDVP